MTRVKIRDVAARAGVSKTAVSFAFNEPSRLPDSTVTKILRVAEDMGYFPHPIARSLSTGRTGAIGLLLPQDIPSILDNSYFIHFIRGFARVCDEQGLSLMLVPVVQRVVTSATVDGFVVVGLEPNDPMLAILGQRHLPIVTVDSEQVDGVSSVNVDDVGGASRAMEYAISQGHRRIQIVAFESGKEGRWRDYTGTLRRRMQGYLKAGAGVGLSLDDPAQRILECENSSEGGARAFQQFWQSPTPSRPTAVVAMSDMIAIGIIHAGRETGLEIPGDLSVIGYDDIPEAIRTIPPLTTVRQPIEEKAELAAELLVRTLAGETDPTHQVLPTELVIRGSVGVPSSPAEAEH